MADPALDAGVDNSVHDDVIKWKHFPRYWPFVRGIHRSAVNFSHKGQWRGTLMFTLICARINGWVNNCEAGDLRRHRVHCDVIVMYSFVYVRKGGPFLHYEKKSNYLCHFGVEELCKLWIHMYLFETIQHVVIFVYPKTKAIAGHPLTQWYTSSTQYFLIHLSIISFNRPLGTSTRRLEAGIVFSHSNPISSVTPWIYYSSIAPGNED